MAVPGLSGSCGGLGNKLESFPSENYKDSLDISYFVNNFCNLNCKHCYVGYSEKNHDLSIEEWKNVFNGLIDMGALTFGNVGKEPLLAWNKTKKLLEFFYEKRKENPKLRFGLVTNATLMNEEIIKDLSDITPNYMDISLDGTREEHDYIRGKGNFDRTLTNMKLMLNISPELSKNVFVSYVLMNHNKNSFSNLVEEVSKEGFKNFLVSPYVKTKTENREKFTKNLEVSNEQALDFYEEIISGKLIDFKKHNNLEILLKNDYDTLKPLMDKCVEKGLIDLKNLLIDEYGVIFNKYDFGSNKIIINYLPINNLFSKVSRISHDGFVGNCYAQFFENYPEKEEVIGNVKEKPIKEILKPFLLN